MVRCLFITGATGAIELRTLRAIIPVYSEPIASRLSLRLEDLETPPLPIQTRDFHYQGWLPTGQHIYAVTGTKMKQVYAARVLPAEAKGANYEEDAQRECYQYLEAFERAHPEIVRRLCSEWGIDRRIRWLPKGTRRCQLTWWVVTADASTKAQSA